MWNKKMGAAAILCTAVLLMTGCGGETAVNRHPTEYIPVKSMGSTDAVLETAGKSVAGYAKKEERGEADADANGTVKELTVTTRLVDPGEGDLIEDHTTLTDIRNTNGDERFLLSDDGKLLFENLGKDITYEGKSGKTLPVTVKVTYYLDGKETAPDDMEGKAGHVKIRFDYENRERHTVTVEDDKEESSEKTESEEYEVYVPFVCVSGVVLDDEDFENVEVKNGDLLRMDDTILAYGQAYPGWEESLRADESKHTDKLPDYVEIEADTNDFSIGFTATIVTTGFFSEDEEEDEEEETDEILDFLGILEKDGDVKDQVGMLAGSFAPLKKTGDRITDFRHRLKALQKAEEEFDGWNYIIKTEKIG